MGKTYRVRPDITPEQIAAAVDALNPFYGFGAVLETANEDRGSACICLHDGKEDQADESTVSLESIEPAGELLSICGSWERVPASYMGPTLTAEHFFAARDAFMACIESVKPEST
jgi:hypothetical protein